MTAMTMANHIFCLLIGAWAVWSFFSDHIDDGIIGKVMLTVVALAALCNSFMSHRISEKPDAAELFFNGALAFYFVYEISATYIRLHGKKNMPEMHTRKSARKREDCQI